MHIKNHKLHLQVILIAWPNLQDKKSSVISISLAKNLNAKIYFDIFNCIFLIEN